MVDKVQTSRRDFLATSARLAAVAGLASAVSAPAVHGAALEVKAGPTPKAIDPDQVIRVGFVGVGGRGGGLLSATLGQPKISVKVIADLDEEHRTKAIAKVKEKQGEAPELYTGEEDYKKLFARDDIDAVIISTPCVLHGEMYLACFAAGKHFYGEKPMCIEAKEADAMVDAQKKNPKVVCQIGFQRRACPRYAEGIRLIREGAIGKVMCARAAWNNGWGPLGGKGAPGTRFWFGRRKTSGDWMLEQACHSWDVLCWVAQDMPIAASGIGRKDIFTDVDPGRDVTDYYLAHLEYPDGMIVDYEHNWFCPRKDEGRYEGVFERIQGPKGGIALDEGRIFPRDPKGEVIQIDKPGGESTGASIAAFFRSLRTGSPPISGVHNGRLATYTGLLVRKAVDEKRRVMMSEII